MEFMQVKTIFLQWLNSIDLEEGLKEGVISEKTCRLIHTWNKEVGREN